jgi:hypothetical protein
MTMKFRPWIDWYPIAWRFRRVTLLAALALLPFGILFISMLAGVKGVNPLSVVVVLATVGGALSLKLWVVVTFFTGIYYLLKPDPTPAN